jgi:hypothetical protein
MSTHVKRGDSSTAHMTRVRVVLVVLVLALAGSASLRGKGVAGQESRATAPDRAPLDRYCVTCHNNKLRTSGLSLEQLNLGDVASNPAAWEKVLGKLRTGTMPPPGRPRPGESESAPLIAWLETSLDRLAQKHPNPGRPTIHRLNRTEYGNAIRELLALEVNVASLLPPDDSGGGFDNIADVLSVSPLLLERYLIAARKVSRLAIGDPSLRDDVYRVPRILVQDERTDEELPLGTRGGIAIRHYFPADGEYLIKIRMQRNLIDEVRGLLHRYTVDVLVDGVRVKSFAIGGDEPEKGKDGLEATYSALATYLTHADDNMEFRLPVTAGPHVIGVTFPNQSVEIEGPPEKPVEPKSWDYYQGKLGLAGVGKVEIRGPYDVTGPGKTASRRRVFICQPKSPEQESACAERIISTIARRAFRRPVTSADLETLLEFNRSGRRDGGFENGIELALQRILVSPYFLFRVEQDPSDARPDTPYRVSDLELASRLSFFLWSSIPDDHLLDLGSRSQLHKPAVLEREVRRMLADERARALVNNFAAQWLGLRNLTFSVPNEDMFPEFDENLRQAFRRETELFVDSIFREDRSVIHLLTANYTYLNERLARHYGIPNIRGNWFRRVTLSDQQAARAGVLGHGSVLTVTSQANRTSPVNRGKWILENILGTPPPPPPPNVPALNEKTSDGKALSMRQAMEAHRKNPVCAACHARMDPLGLALENFSAIGQWRAKGESNEPIDASGELPSGTKFDGPLELRSVLLAKREQFVETVTEKLLMYATGRGLEYHDYPTVRAIVRDAAANGYRASSLVLGVVRSAPFQMRQPAEKGEDTRVAAGR